MPIYEFQCQECGSLKELLWNRMVDELTIGLECEKCGDEKPHKKVLSTVNHKYKGSGFYATDYQTREKKVK
jgi:putative FmdB family regulatory protein